MECEKWPGQHASPDPGANQSEVHFFECGSYSGEHFVDAFDWTLFAFLWWF
jgi:hypothetical protein